MASRPKQPQPRPAPRLYLVTPPLADTTAFAAGLPEALGTADVAAVLLRLEDADERTLINRIKVLAPMVQDGGAALLLEGRADLVARSGADGSHLSGIDAFNAALELLKPERIAGVGDLANRHDAMVAAEAEADYLLFGRPQTPSDVTLERVGWSSEVFELPTAGFAKNVDDIAALVAAGADFVALDYVWSDPRGAAAAIADTAAHLRLPDPVA